MGQHFLTDLNLVRLLVRAAELGPDDVVLEVGTGTGSLTAMMAPLVAAVVTVEIDRQLFELASEELDALGNVRMLQLDALQTKSRLDPAVLEAIREEMAKSPGGSSSWSPISPITSPRRSCRTSWPWTTPRGR